MGNKRRKQFGSVRKQILPKNKIQNKSSKSRSNGFSIETPVGKFRPLPQAKLFFCFSKNTSNEVLLIQHHFLLANLLPQQRVDWVPMAWNVMSNVSAFGSGSYTAQDMIDACARRADYIIFVVKDEIYEGLLHEWKLWTENPEGKIIYLFIYDDDKTNEIHHQLDPNKQIIYRPYTTYQDILLCLQSEIQPKFELSLETQKLCMVRTPAEMYTYLKELNNRIKYLKITKSNDTTIKELEKYLHIVELKKEHIILHNKQQLFCQSAVKKQHNHVMALSITKECLAFNGVTSIINGSIKDAETRKEEMDRNGVCAKRLNNLHVEK